MKLQYQIKYGKINDGKNDNGEFTLLAFNGKCYNCGNNGHKAIECTKPKQKKKKGGKGQKFN